MLKPHVIACENKTRGRFHKNAPDDLASPDPAKRDESFARKRQKDSRHATREACRAVPALRSSSYKGAEDKTSSDRTFGVARSHAEGKRAQMLVNFRVELRWNPRENEFAMSSVRFQSSTLNSGVARTRLGCETTPTNSSRLGPPIQGPIQPVLVTNDRRARPSSRRARVPPELWPLGL